jgi:tRNA(fMet)-specific endonuclease VapC
MRLFLNTNIVSNPIREPHGQVADRIKAVGESSVCTSIIAASELRYGGTKKASPRLTAQVDAVLGALDPQPFDLPSDETYGLIRMQLETAGMPIGGDDLLIAAHALALDSAPYAIDNTELRSMDCPGNDWHFWPMGTRAAAWTGFGPIGRS